MGDGVLCNTAARQAGNNVIPIFFLRACTATTSTPCLPACLGGDGKIRGRRQLIADVQPIPSSPTLAICNRAMPPPSPRFFHPSNPQTPTPLSPPENHVESPTSLPTLKPNQHSPVPHHVKIQLETHPTSTPSDPTPRLLQVGIDTPRQQRSARQQTHLAPTGRGTNARLFQRGRRTRGASCTSQDPGLRTRVRSPAGCSSIPPLPVRPSIHPAALHRERPPGGAGWGKLVVSMLHRGAHTPISLF